MSGYGNGQGGGGGGEGQGYFPPPQGVYPQYNSYSSPPPSFPSPQTNLYPPYPNTPNSNSSTLPTPHHQQSSSSSSSLTPEFPQQANSTTSSPPISQNNSSQYNSNQFNSNQFNNSGQFAVNLHVGEAPKVQPRRYKTQTVKLTNGNVVLSCRVPSKLTSSVPLNSDEEFTHVRYTACTCDPDFFQEDGYSLRQRIYNRSTEIFIVITMYNEEAELFARTFYGVVKNIHKLCQRDRSRVWGADGWQKVVVCVVSDGRSKIDKRTEDYLAAIGVYQKGIAKEKINDKKVTAHIYEYTTQICLDDKMKPVGDKVGYTPIQVLFCLKEKNQKKINSHRWFFNAFGRILQPNICILLDAGTKPGGKSIYHLWKAFDTNSNIGGACGEIVAMKGSGGKLLINPLVAAQNFEYKMSNILDKPLESVFGYITVLPGAFSAYRYIALQNEYDPVLKKEVGPLASYFMGEKHHGGGPPKRKKKSDPNSEKDEEEEEEEIETGLFTANMYLAEDRILCFELVSKRKSSWVLHYVKSAYAETDVPSDIIELIRQRRRWLNGSFFAGLYAICHTSSIWRSHHTGWKKFVLLIEMAYQTFNLAFSWFALGNLYLTFHILGNSLASDKQATEGLWSLTAGTLLFRILQTIYIALIILQFSLALGNKPQSAKRSYILSTAFFALLMFYMLFAAGWISYKGVKNSQAKVDEANVNAIKEIFGDPTFKNVVVALLSTYGLYVIASLLFFEPYHMIHSSLQYLLLTPFYVNILNVYAFCNIHDVSWGTKGDTKADKLEHAQVTIQNNTAKVDLPEDVDEEYERVQSSLSNEPEQPKPLSDYSAVELKELLINKSKELSAYKLDKLSAEEIKRLPADDIEKIQKLQKNVREVQERLQELQEESNSMFRTVLVFAWMISNGILVGLVTSFVPNLDTLSVNQKSNAYFAFILWAVAGLAAFRFVGSCVYLILRLFNENIFDGLIK